MRLPHVKDDPEWFGVSGFAFGVEGLGFYLTQCLYYLVYVYFVCPNSYQD